MTNITKQIDFRERPWAVRREFQRFFGVYVLDRASRIYIHQDTEDPDRKLVSTTFRRLPAQMRHRCREYEVTFSTSGISTATGSSSAFYGDFSRSREGISPHIEMSKMSLTPDLVLPHMTHEAAHLWWRTLPHQARQAYARFLRESCPPGTIEVTEYAHEHFLDFSRMAAAGRAESCSECHQRRCQTVWTEESFCETVAVLHVPAHRSRRPDSTVNVAARTQAIGDITGLRIA